MSVSGLLNQTVQLAPRVDATKGGRAVYGPAVTYRARVEYKSKMIRGKDGVDRASTARVFLDGSAPVDRTDQITLPDGTQPEIIEVEGMPGRYGSISYRTVYV